jgi:hypothetical protein
VDVVAVAGPARVFDRRETAADARGPVDTKRFQPGAAEISLEDEAVVSRAEEDAVVPAQWALSAL